LYDLCFVWPKIGNPHPLALGWTGLEKSSLVACGIRIVCHDIGQLQFICQKQI
jgi:hypothetical protein